jgi:hypothetical protein
MRTGALQSQTCNPIMRTAHSRPQRPRQDAATLSPTTKAGDQIMSFPKMEHANVEFQANNTQNVYLENTNGSVVVAQQFDAAFGGEIEKGVGNSGNGNYIDFQDNWIFQH